MKECLALSLSCFLSVWVKMSDVALFQKRWSWWSHYRVVENLEREGLAADWIASFQTNGEASSSVITMIAFLMNFQLMCVVQQVPLDVQSDVWRWVKEGEKGRAIASEWWLLCWLPAVWWRCCWSGSSGFWSGLFSVSWLYCVVFLLLPPPVSNRSSNSFPICQFTLNLYYQLELPITSY